MPCSSCSEWLRINDSVGLGAYEVVYSRGLNDYQYHFEAILYGLGRELCPAWMLIETLAFAWAISARHGGLALRGLGGLGV